MRRLRECQPQAPLKQRSGQGSGQIEGKDELEWKIETGSREVEEDREPEMRRQLILKIEG